MRRPLMSAAAEPERADGDDAESVPSEDGPADAGPADDDDDDGDEVGDHDDELAEITKVAGAGDAEPGGADSDAVIGRLAFRRAGRANLTATLARLP